MLFVFTDEIDSEIREEERSHKNVFNSTGVYSLICLSF